MHTIRGIKDISRIRYIRDLYTRSYMTIYMRHRSGCRLRSAIRLRARACAPARSPASPASSLRYSQAPRANKWRGAICVYRACRALWGFTARTMWGHHQRRYETRCISDVHTQVELKGCVAHQYICHLYVLSTPLPSRSKPCLPCQTQRYRWNKKLS